MGFDHKQPIKMIYPDSRFGRTHSKAIDTSSSPCFDDFSRPWAIDPTVSVPVP